MLGLWSGPCLAANKAKIKQQTPTSSGSTGIFNVFVADTLRKGEYSVAIGGLRFHRELGAATVAPVSFTVGLHERIEIFASHELYRRLDLDAGPGSMDREESRVPAPDPNSSPSWNGEGDGRGDFRAGFKVNLMSERRGQALGLALQNRFLLSFDKTRANLELEPVSGQKGLGLDLILSKDVGRVTFSANTGWMWVSRSFFDEWPIERRSRFNWGLGADVPMGRSKTHFMGELIGSALEKDGAPTPVDTPSLLEFLGGFRIFAGRRAALSLAYNLKLATTGAAVETTGRHGWFVQLALQRKRNRPPIILCPTNAIALIEGESAAIRAQFNDPDDDELTVTWSATGGRLHDPGATVVFDSTGLDAGSYTLSVEATDGQNLASCSSDILVEKRKIPPTIACEFDVVNVTEGGSITLSAVAFDSNGDRLTYSWTVDGEVVPNNRAEFEFGTVGRAVGPHQVKVSVTDTDGLSASCEMRVIVDCHSERGLGET